MTQPAVYLIIFAATTAGFAALFWPRKGIVARALRLVHMTERARTEDALKHLHDREYLGKPSSLAGLAGTLEMSRAKAVKLVARLESLGLIHSDGDGLPLTASGREYALRIIRSHRLWERYLADRTSVKPGDWHEKAEQREHTLTLEAVEELDSRMGHPRYDPHGDPIPTADGELPPPTGVALTALEPGRQAVVLHLEDEPPEVYDRLVAAGLAPLMEISVLDVSPDRIRFTVDGTELVLPPVVATNVTVQPLPPGRERDTAGETLDALQPGESASIVRISPACRGAQRRRLLDLGLVPGTTVRAQLVGAMRDPTAYEIRGALIALRRKQAEWIYIDRGSVVAGARN